MRNFINANAGVALVNATFAVEVAAQDGQPERICTEADMPLSDTVMSLRGFGEKCLADVNRVMAEVRHGGAV